MARDLSKLLDLLTPPAVADLASVDDLLTVDDLPEVTIRVPFWLRDGQPLAIRVRALDLDQQDTVRMAAQRAVKAQDRQRGVHQHWPTYVWKTWQLGCISPKLTADQAQRLCTKHAEATEQVVELIWTISRLNQTTIDGIVAHLIGQGDLDAPADAPVVTDEELPDGVSDDPDRATAEPDDSAE
jgi:hypothetical protein